MSERFEEFPDIEPFSEDDSGLGAIGHPTNDTSLEELLDSMIRKYPVLSRDIYAEREIPKRPRKSLLQSFRDVCSLLPAHIRIMRSTQSDCPSPLKRRFSILGDSDSESIWCRGTYLGSRSSLGRHGMHRASIPSERWMKPYRTIIHVAFEHAAKQAQKLVDRAEVPQSFQFNALKDHPLSLVLEVHLLSIIERLDGITFGFEGLGNSVVRPSIDPLDCWRCSRKGCT